jgi:hypothetical protein
VEKTVHGLVARNILHPTKEEQELLTNELYQQIGQLKVELDWLKKKSGYDT